MLTGVLLILWGCDQNTGVVIVMDQSLLLLSSRYFLHNTSVYIHLLHTLCLSYGLVQDLHCQARSDHQPRRQCSLYGLNLQLDSGGGSSHAFRWIARRGRSQTSQSIILVDSVSLLQRVKRGSGKLVSTFEHSCGCTALDRPESREMTK